MCIVKDLLTREDLKHVKRVLEILPEDAPISYEVWAIGYTNNNKKEILLRRFEDSSAAVDYASKVYLLDAVNAIAGNNKFNYATDYVFIEVETVIDDTRGSTVNLGTLFKNNLFMVEKISQPFGWDIFYQLFVYKLCYLCQHIFIQPVL